MWMSFGFVVGLEVDDDDNTDDASKFTAWIQLEIVESAGA